MALIPYHLVQTISQHMHVRLRPDTVSSSSSSHTCSSVLYNPSTRMLNFSDAGSTLWKVCSLRPPGTIPPGHIGYSTPFFLFAFAQCSLCPPALLLHTHTHMHTHTHTHTHISFSCPTVSQTLRTSDSLCGSDHGYHWVCLDTRSSWKFLEEVPGNFSSWLCPQLSSRWDSRTCQAWDVWVNSGWWSRGVDISPLGLISISPLENRLAVTIPPAGLLCCPIP